MDVPKVLVLDGNSTFRFGLRSAVENAASATVVGEAASSEEALSQIEALNPSVLLVDWQSAQPQFEKLLRAARDCAPPARILVCSDAVGHAMIIRALQSGAGGVVTKNTAPETLVEAITAVSRNELFLQVHAKQRAGASGNDRDHDAPASQQLSRLTAREREIFRLVAQGMLTHEIAEHLYISKRTVENHRSSLMRKLELRNQVDLVRYAGLNGLLDL